MLCVWYVCFYDPDTPTRQVDRVSAYYEVLRKVQACTPDTHPFATQLEDAIRNWSQLLRGTLYMYRIRPPATHQHPFTPPSCLKFNFYFFTPPHLFCIRATVPFFLTCLHHAI